MKRHRNTIAVLLALCACGTAHAHDEAGHTHWWIELGESFGSRDWYAGASVMQTSLDDGAFVDDGSYTSASKDNQPVGFRVFGAIAWRYAAIEVGYVDAGEATYAAQSDGSGQLWNAGPMTESVEATGFDLSLIGRIPINQAWTAFAKAGVFISEVDASITGDLQCCGPGTFAESDSGRELLYGIGVERSLGNWKLGAAYQSTTIDTAFLVDEADVEGLSLSVAYVWRGSR